MFCQNKTVSSIFVLTTFDASGNIFFSYFRKFYKVKRLHNRFLCKRSCSYHFLSPEFGSIAAEIKILEWILLRCFSAKRRQFPRFLYLPHSVLEEISLSWYCGKKFIVKWIHNRFLVKEMTLITFSFPEMTLSRNSVNSAFLFWLYSSERKRRICRNFSFINQFQRFLSNENTCHYTDFGNLERILLRCFSTKRRQFPGFLH